MTSAWTRRAPSDVGTNSSMRSVPQAAFGYADSRGSPFLPLLPTVLMCVALSGDRSSPRSVVSALLQEPGVRCMQEQAFTSHTDVLAVVV